MATILRTALTRRTAQPPTFFTAVAREWTMLLEAMLSPGRLVEEVEQVRELLTRADALDASDPARAAHLRRQASRIGVP